ncbi:MAG: hypothetical protein ACPGRX_03110 [Bdellovibrionales bacterium]
MSDIQKQKCDICDGPHHTSAHFDWVEKSEGIISEHIAAELQKYAKPLKAMQTGGIAAAENALNDMGLTMTAGECFCGTPNHTGPDHLRWLADKEAEV